MPISFVRVRQFKQLGVWWFECRLIQAPLAFNSGHERVLPVPPTVRRIRTGSAGSETEPPVNELQALHLPPDFRGTYFLRWNYRISKLLGIEDGPDEIAAALNAMFEKGKRFEATNPEPDNAYVEFIGELGGSPQPLITVEVNTFAPGVLTFTLPLDRAEMAAALRAVAEIEVPFEVEAEIVDDGEDIADPAVPGRIITLLPAAGESRAGANLGGNGNGAADRLAASATAAGLHPVHARPDHRRRAALRCGVRRRGIALAFVST